MRKNWCWIGASDSSRAAVRLAIEEYMWQLLERCYPDGVCEARVVDLYNHLRVGLFPKLSSKQAIYVIQKLIGVKGFGQISVCRRHSRSIHLVN